MTVDYDSLYDTLYVALGDKTHSYGDDSREDAIIMRDYDTDAITGFTIMQFSKKYQAQRLDDIQAYLGISIDSEILPKIKSTIPSIKQ